MLVYNLEYRVLDKLNRTKSTVHVGVYKSKEDVEYAKQKVFENLIETKIAFDIYAIDNIF